MSPLPTSVAVLAILTPVVAALVSPHAASRVSSAIQQSPRAALAIVVNHRNPVTGLSVGELRRVFLLDMQYWPTGRRITLVLREEGQPARSEALRLVCGMVEDEYRRHLMLQFYRGRPGSAAPRSIRTTEGMLAFVRNAPGAIGHVEAASVNDTVKVLRIEGRLPPDADYPLMVASAPRSRRGASVNLAAERWPVSTEPLR